MGMIDRIASLAGFERRSGTSPLDAGSCSYDRLLFRFERKGG